MRFLYVDETGRSAPTDPALIVLCLIVDADKQYAAAEALLAQTLASVPARYQDGFIAHAWEIFNNSKKYREGWTFNNRLRFLQSLVEIPGQLDIPIAVGLVRHPPYDKSKQAASIVDKHHQVAFGLCLAAADEYICLHGGAQEVSTVVAENIPEMESRLLQVARDLTSGTVELSQDPGAQIRVLRMTDTIHFVAKDDGPFLQIVDACAWVFQRFLSGRKFGPELFAAMTGIPAGAITPDHFGPWGRGVLYPPRPTQP